MMRNPWTAFFDWYKHWIKDLATTGHIIVVGVGLSVIYVLWALLADTLGRPLSELTLNGIGLFIAGMLYGGVAQFGVKRLTDRETVAAKAAATTAARATTAMPAIKEGA